MQYRKEIDGLRSIAVIPVILFHAGLPFFNGGFIGVDIFFVISGYLITTIVSSEIELGKFSIINFYERRARRIMPMLFFILLICFIYAWFILLPSDMKSFSSSLVSVIFFYSNIHFFFESGYWDISSELKPLLHTWSLAVEEQFYLFFPVFLYLVRKLKKSIPVLLVVLFTIISLGISQWASTHAATANFYMLPTRFWELAIGALIGMVSVKYTESYNKLSSNKIINEVMGTLGLVMIFYSIFCFTASTPFPSVIALVPTLGTAMIIIFSSGNTIIGKLLGLSPLVKIGLISYSAYLWHQPLLAFAKYQVFPELSVLMKVILVLMVFPLSYLSWKYIESPFRNKVVFTKKKIFAFWALGSLLFLTIGCIGIMTNGFESRSIVSSQKILNYQPDNKLLQKESLEPLLRFAKQHNAEYKTVGSDFDNALWYDTLNPKYKLLVIGNSHGENIYNTLTFSNSVKAKFQLARYGYQIRDFKDPNNKLFESPNYKACDVVVIGSRLVHEDFAVMDDVLKKIYADGKVVVIIKNVFLFNTFGSRTLADFVIQKKISKNPDMDSKAISNLVDVINKEYYNEFEHGRKTDLEYLEAETLKNLTEKYKDLVVLDRMDYMCDYDKKICYVINNQLEKYIFDDAHNAIQGSVFYGKRIDELDWMKTSLIYDKLNKKKPVAK